jgi:hypothetical protein
MGGSDDEYNIAVLTAREHFVAHQLLVKIYPSVGGLIAAVRYLTVTSKHVVRNNRMYEWLRVKHAAEMSRINKGKKMLPEQIAKAAASHLGKKRSAESKARMAKAASEREISEEGRASLRAAKALEHFKRKAAGIAHHNVGKKRTEEWKQNNSKLFKGKKQSPEQVAKRVAARRATLLARAA